MEAEPALISREATQRVAAKLDLRLLILRLERIEQRGEGRGLRLGCAIRRVESTT